jgi:[ribosomal protein S5]-alanine N-acetyltransferase
MSEMHEQGILMKIDGQNVFLKSLVPEEVGQYYADWLNDPEIVKYLESRWKSYNLSDVKNYIQTINNGDKDYLLGIFLNGNNRHIGNIKIGGIDPIHRFANLGLIIGEKECWGKGYGTEAISLATQIAFHQLNLNCLIAGIYSPNLSSYRAFINAGWEEAGRFKKYRFFDGHYVDQINVQICRNESSD